LQKALETDAHRPKRDRRTALKLWQEISAQGFTGSYSRVTEFVRHWREGVGQGAATKAFVPLKFALGEAFQFDWSEEGLIVGGIYRRLQVAHLKLCASRAFVLVAYPSQGHEMLFDAHTRAFAALGGIPRRGIYDNMKTAVDKVHKGKGRTVNARFAALASHYLFDTVMASHLRQANAGNILYDWQHYIPLLERKPGALRNGAPFADMPEALQRLRRGLLKREGGDRIMAKVLAAVPGHGLEAVLVAVELVLESGVLSVEHVENVLSRIRHPAPSALTVETGLVVEDPPVADTGRYDALRTAEVDHA
jgi:hypothetical protein